MKKLFAEFFGTFLGLWAGGKFEAKDLVGYIIAQLIGAVAAAGALYVIITNKADFVTIGGFAANGYGDLSPDGYSMVAALMAEFLLTMFFLLIILGSTNARAPKGFAPIAIGLGLTLIHLISIPITNTSVNPARSTSQALFAGGDFTGQLWLFWVAPIAGAIVGASSIYGIFLSVLSALSNIPKFTILPCNSAQI